VLEFHTALEGNFCILLRSSYYSLKGWCTNTYEMIGLNQPSPCASYSTLDESAQLRVAGKFRCETVESPTSCHGSILGGLQLSGRVVHCGYATWKSASGSRTLTIPYSNVRRPLMAEPLFPMNSFVSSFHISGTPFSVSPAPLPGNEPYGQCIISAVRSCSLGYNETGKFASSFRRALLRMACSCQHLKFNSQVLPLYKQVYIMLRVKTITFLLALAVRSTEAAPRSDIHKCHDVNTTTTTDITQTFYIYYDMDATWLDKSDGVSDMLPFHDALY
jgi:hypothetical protein